MTESAWRQGEDGSMVHDPGGLGFRIQTLWAFVAVHEDGDEGLVAGMIGGQWMPLIAADEARLADLRPLAEKIVAATGKPVRLVRFDTRTEVDTIGERP